MVSRSDDDSVMRSGHSIKIHLIILGVFLVAFFGLETFDWIAGDALDRYGIRPRTLQGLKGIPLAPFLHADFVHLLGNALPFALLGWLILLQGVWRFFGVYLLVCITAGIGPWLLGDAGTVHIGASGIIFGFLGYLLFGALFRRSLKSVLLSLAAGALYGGLVFGILPGAPGVSWEGHLFGFLGGILAARLFSSRQTPHEPS